MAFSEQTTKLRLLKLLQHSLASQPNTTVSLSELAQTLNVSRERVRQLYHQLAVEYALPPVKKRRPGIGEIKQPISHAEDMVRKLRTPSPQTLALEDEVRKYIRHNMSVPEIARKIGRPAPTIYTVLQRLDIPFKRAKDTGRRLRNSSTLALEAEVRQYSEQGMSAPEIAKRTGRSESNIQRIHHRLHIPLPRRRKSQETLALEAEVREYSEQGMTAPEIAKRTGRPGRTIYEVLSRLGIPRNYMGKAVYSATSPQTLALEAEVRAYSEQGLTTAEIARKTGKHLQTIYRVLHRLHIPFNSALRRKSSETRALEAEVRQYSEQGMSAPEIGRKTGRNRKTVYSVLRRLGIPFKRAIDTGRRMRNPKTLAFEAEVKWYYFSLGMSSKDIASTTGRNMKTVYATLRRLGVPSKKRVVG